MITSRACFRSLVSLLVVLPLAFVLPLKQAHAGFASVTCRMASGGLSGQWLLTSSGPQLQNHINGFRTQCSRDFRGTVTVDVRCNTPGWVAHYYGVGASASVSGKACGYRSRAEAERAAFRECRAHRGNADCQFVFSGCDDGSVNEPLSNNNPHYSLKHFSRKPGSTSGGSCLVRTAVTPAKKPVGGEFQPHSYKACRYFDKNGRRVKMPSRDAEEGLKRGYLSRKECFVRTCRVYDQSGGELDFSMVAPGGMLKELAKLRKQGVKTKVECVPPN